MESQELLPRGDVVVQSVWWTHPPLATDSYWAKIAETLRRTTNKKSNQTQYRLAVDII